MKIILTLIITLGATAALIILGNVASKRPFTFSKLAYINTQTKYQLFSFGVAVLVLASTYLVDPVNFANFFTMGNISAPVNLAPWLNFGNNLSWGVFGISLAIFITSGTSFFIYLQFRKYGDSFKKALPFLPWVLLFSLMNSFSEEVIYRLGVIIPLFKTIDLHYILLISAIIFGLPHLRGMPNGVIGAAMAGFLGWFLAKSVVDTNGLFWAWLIHCMQDIVIFYAFIVAAIKISKSESSTSDLPAST